MNSLPQAQPILSITTASDELNLSVPTVTDATEIDQHRRGGGDDHFISLSDCRSDASICSV